jgi:hypothetical protein
MESLTFHIKVINSILIAVKKSFADTVRRGQDFKDRTLYNISTPKGQRYCCPASLPRQLG